MHLVSGKRSLIESKVPSCICSKKKLNKKSVQSLLGVGGIQLMATPDLACFAHCCFYQGCV